VNGIEMVAILMLFAIREGDLKYFIARAYKLLGQRVGIQGSDSSVTYDSYLAPWYIGLKD